MSKIPHSKYAMCLFTDQKKKKPKKLKGKEVWAIPLIINKIISISLTKNIEDIYTKFYKMKEIEDTIKNNYLSWIEALNLSNCL